MTVVFAIELRRAFVAYLERRIGRVEPFRQHESPGFLQSKMLLVL
jgi:hypothetical protein